jgi:subtilisin family serine protease
MLRPRKASLLFLALAAAPAAFAAEYKPGEVIVQYKEGIRPRVIMNALYDSLGVTNVQHYNGMMKGFEHLYFDEDVKVEDVIAELKKNSAVAYAQPNYILHALPITTHQGESARMRRQGVPCLFPGIPFPPGCDDSGDGGGGEDEDPQNPTHPENPSDPSVNRPQLKDAPPEVIPPVADPDLFKAYGLAKIGATQAWSIFRGSKSFIVADIDTGIDYNHQDLAFNLWRNPKPSDKNDIVGFDFVHNDGLPFDDNNHGTHTAGTIGAVGGNGIGISGVTQQVSLMALKFLSGDGSGTTADAIRAIDYAIEHGAKILSNSWGGRGDTDNQALKDAIERARAKDVLFVAAAGNDGSDNDGSDPAYPAAFDNDNMISVAATDDSDSLAYFSNYGKKTTHVAAPGVRIYSTIPGDKYKALSGTSMACPHVAGAVALIWSQHPTWNYKKVKETLLSTVDPLPVLTNKTVSGGRVNLIKALSKKDTDLF